VDTQENVRTISSPLSSCRWRRGEEEEEKNGARFNKK